MIKHILLKRKNSIGSVVDIVSVWKVLSFFFLHNVCAANRLR